MSRGFPVEGRIFVLKNEESLGPFKVDEILDFIEEGTFGYDDICLREGAIETERLRNVLDWDKPRATKKTPAPSKSEITQHEDDPIEDDFDESDEETESIDPLESPSEILYRGSRSILTFPLSFLGLVGGVIGVIWLYPIDIKLMLACLVIAALSLSYLSLMKFTCEYFITPKRIELEKGLIAKSSNEVRISDLRAINVTCTGFIGILGVGSVEFFTTGDEPEVTFQDIWAAKEVKKLVRRLQDSSG
ncbi:MAG: PH domain-containing protein [Verrucomicrobiales bacterium]|nr:PH domain-containing protein [Verrucomicrobiales bacterium]